MDGIRTEVPSEEKVGGATAAGSVRRFGRASTSFSLQETLWLHEVMLALLTRNQHRLRELSTDPIGLTVAQKALGLKRKAEASAGPVVP